MRRLLTALLAVFVLGGFSDECGDEFKGPQAFCYHFCREQLKGRAEPVAKENEDFTVEVHDGKSYCWCRVRVQLPTLIPAEEEKK